MKAEVQDKQEQILEAAIRRFSHFGFNKTTMTEIADDLAMSRQSLFYYYPDKQSLVGAVEKKITEEYAKELEREMEKAGTVKAALLKLVDIKKQFLEKYFMLMVQAEASEWISNKSITEAKEQVEKRECAILCALFEEGVAKKELKPLDAQKTAGLLLDTIAAFAFCVKGRSIIPEAAAFGEMYDKQQEVMKLFYNGLKQ